MVRVSLLAALALFACFCENDAGAPGTDTVKTTRAIKFTYNPGDSVAMLSAAIRAALTAAAATEPNAFLKKMMADLAGTDGAADVMSFAQQIRNDLDNNTGFTDFTWINEHGEAEVTHTARDTCYGLINLEALQPAVSAKLLEHEDLHALIADQLVARVEPSCGKAWRDDADLGVNQESGAATIGRVHNAIAAAEEAFDVLTDHSRNDASQPLVAQQLIDGYSDGGCP